MSDGSASSTGGRRGAGAGACRMVRLRRSLLGFQVKVMGEPRPAVRRFQPGACDGGGDGDARRAAGIAGMVEVSANIGQLQPDISFGYGFTAIIVAFLARLNPLR